jgi:hypothetical protein
MGAVASMKTDRAERAALTAHNAIRLVPATTYTPKVVRVVVIPWPRFTDDAVKTCVSGSSLALSECCSVASAEFHGKYAKMTTTKHWKML